MIPLTKIKITIAKLLYKLVTPFIGSKTKIIDRNGIKYEVDLSEGIDFSLYLFGGFQSHVYDTNLINIKEDATIIDIGGNFGVMALRFAKMASKGQVISFEPTEYAIAKFNRNLQLNPELAERITIINSFVSAKTEKDADIKAYSSWKIDDLVHKGEHHPVHLGTAKSTHGVGSVTLNEFCSQHDLKLVDFIKIDTDGHEYEVFNGAEEAIKKYRPQIVFEVGKYVMQEKDIDFNFYVDYFTNLNYELFDLTTKKKINSKNWQRLIPDLGTIDVLAKPV